LVWLEQEKRAIGLWIYCNERSKIHVNRLIFAGQGRQLTRSFNLNEMGETKTGQEIQLNTEKLRILSLIFSGKHKKNYTKPETEGALKPIMFLIFLE
jgi:hypothetical protein